MDEALVAKWLAEMTGLRTLGIEFNPLSRCLLELAIRCSTFDKASQYFASQVGAITHRGDEGDLRDLLRSIDILRP